MRYNVTVDIPYRKKLPYTLYAKGSLIGIPYFDKNEDFVHFKFEGGTVFILFYTFKKFRRAYIATGWESGGDGEAVTLPGTNEKLCLVFSARGKKIDILKRVLYILTEEQNDSYSAFSLPLIFWYRIAGLIQHCGASRSDLEILWENFTGKKLIKPGNEARFKSKRKTT